MPEQIRVNIKHRVTNTAIRKEERDGREVIVVPSVVAKFNTVLNDIFYGEDELRKSYQQVNGLPAPLGHPVINGQYVSARSPEAINRHWAGAWNEGARIDGDVIRADKLIDVETANESERGRRLLQAIEAGEPISTSTGLLMEREPAPEGMEAKWVGMNFMFDHDAILLDEAPAISPEDGVGMMVNADGTEVEVVNSELKLNEELPGSMEDMRRALKRAVEEKYGNGFIDDFNGESVIFFHMDDDKTYKIGYSVMDGKLQISDERKEVQRKTTWEAVTNTIRNTLSKMFGASPGDTKKAPGLNVNSSKTSEVEMTPEELQAALDKQAESLTAAFNAKIDEAVKAAVDPVQEKLTAMNAEREAAQKAEHDKAVEAVVNAKLLEQEEAEAMPVAALNSLLKASKKAAPLAPGMSVNGSEQDAWADYDLNANMEAK